MYPPAALATDKTDDTIEEADHAPHHNDLGGGINDIVTELGSDPKGISADVTERLDDADTVVAGHTTHLNTVDTRLDGLEGPRDSCKVYQVDIANDADEVVIPFENELYKNPVGLHSNVTDPSRLIAVQTGIYIVSACIEFAVNATGTRYFMRIVRNGDFGDRVAGQISISDPGIRNVLSCSGLTRLTAGEYVEATSFQATGSTLPFNAQFEFHFLGDVL